jgi:FKBP-type peptidyl-prolyl cis-trans isomerase FkpA
MSKHAVVPALLAALLVAGCNEASQMSEGSSSSSSSASSTTPSTTTSAAPSGAEAAGGKVHKLASGLQYEDLTVGSGKMAEPGMNVSVHYTGWLNDEARTKFDSSHDRSQPFQFQLGAGQVIKGWDEGVKGMRIGGKRKLTIPPDLGYGARGASGIIPPNATLLFDVELLDVK